MQRGVLLAVLVAACASEPAPSDPPKCTKLQLGEACVPELSQCRDVEAPTTTEACAPVAFPCGPGFLAAEIGCAPVAPKDVCPRGTMALPGETVCKPLGGCDRALPSGATVYVDASKTGGDGTRERPFTTIGAAVAAITADDTIVAIARGVYQENIKLTRRVRLFGECATSVEIQGTDPALPTIDGLKTAFEVHRVSVTGAYVGIRTTDSVGTVIEDAWIHDTAERGISIEGPNRDTEATVRRVLVEAPSYAGITALGAKVTLDEVAIRGVRLRGGSGGFGLVANAHPATMTKAHAAARRVVIEKTSQAAISSYGGDVVVRDAWIRDVSFARGAALGIFSSKTMTGGVCGSLDVQSTVIEGAGFSGITVRGCSAKLSSVSVRNVRADPSGNQGQGLHFVETRAELDGIAVDHVEHLGIIAEGADVTAKNVIVRDVVAPRATPETGLGIAAVPWEAKPSSLTLTDAVILRTRTLGLLVWGSRATVVNTFIHDIDAATDGRFGDGVGAATRWFNGPVVATLSLRNVRIARVARAGVHVNGADASFVDTSVKCARFPIEFTTAYSTLGKSRPEAALTDDGGNQCAGCDQKIDLCRAQSSDLDQLELAPSK